MQQFQASFVEVYHPFGGSTINKSNNVKDIIRAITFTFIGRVDGGIDIVLHLDSSKMIRIENPIHSMAINGIVILENAHPRKQVVSIEDRKIIHTVSLLSSSIDGTIFLSLLNITLPKGVESNALLDDVGITISHRQLLMTTRKAHTLLGIQSTTINSQKKREKYIFAVTNKAVMVWEEKNIGHLHFTKNIPCGGVVDFSVLESQSGVAQILLFDGGSAAMMTIDMKTKDVKISEIENMVDQLQSIHTLPQSNKVVLFNGNESVVFSLDLPHERVDGRVVSYQDSTNYIVLIEGTHLVQLIDGNLMEIEILQDPFVFATSNNIIAVASTTELTTSFFLRKDGKVEKLELINRSNYQNGEMTDQVSDERFIPVEASNMLSRILYTNPVCLLTSLHENQRNVMTITWLTPVDNSAHFICSMNRSRHSSSLVTSSKRFSLSVPTADISDIVLKIGGCSGSEIDKFEQFVGDTLGGSKPLTIIQRNTSSGNFICFRECCAHMCCVIEKELESICPGHHLFYCKIIEGHVKEGYWKEGKNFIPLSDNFTPYLTFLGSQNFACTTPMTDC